MIQPTLRIEVLTKTFYCDNTALIKDRKFTFLGADATSGTATLTVQSIVGFAINKILLIGEIGNETTEIIKTHSLTAPSGTTITLASNLVFAHNQDTKVYILDYNQAEFSRATTVTGTKTTLATIDLQSDQKETQYRDTTNTTGYGFVRFKDDINTLYSGYSDAVPYEGYDDNTVFMIKKRALESINETIGDLITHDFLNETLWQARREYHDAPGKRPFRMRYESDLGNVTTGMYRIAVPTDLDEPYSAKNIFGIRVGVEEDCQYYTKKEWDEDYEDVSHTAVATQASAGDTSITFDDTRDFDESGSFQVGTQTASITYTANNESTGVLSGIPAAGETGAISATIPVDTDVWQDASFGLPQYFTVFPDASGVNYIYFDCPIDDDYADQNIWIDYYRTVVAYDSDSDVLDEPEFDMFVNYLDWCIKKRKNAGLQALDDNDYQLYLAKKASSLANEYLGQEVKFIPDIPI